MADNQNDPNRRDPYQYERILRQWVQQTFLDRTAGASRGQGRPAGAPPAEDSARELARSIRELSQAVAQEVGGALGDATREMSSALNDAARQVRGPAAQNGRRAQPGAVQQSARRAGDALAARVNQAGGSLSNALRDGLCVFGGTLAVCAALVCGIVSLTVLLGLVLYFEVIGFISLVFLLGLTAAFGFTARWAFQQPGRRARLRRYLTAMGADRSAPVRRLAEAVRRPAAYVRKDLDRMIRQGWLPDAFLDDEEDIFFVSAAEYRATQRRQEAAARTQAEPAGQGELADLLQQCDDFDLLLGEHIENMADQPALQSRLMHLRQTARDIRGWVAAHPAGAGKARKFARYYMPTTLKLLRAYADVKHQQGDAAGGIREEIDGILTTLNTAFDNLRNDLLSDTALDISSEISAMQTMLAQDGLAEYSSPQ
ncbi:MAG TPA: hypothetical protein H9795_06025 [Candidatus Fournierella merdigallinarum]|nr:hypothetical protein [Candidatus Fournierella merdigallinarum]